MRDGKLPCERARYLPHAANFTWNTTLITARQDICNIRLVTKQLRGASHESFAIVLGDRRVRLTKTGLSDLRSMAVNEDLVPWIRILTFGTAQLSALGNSPIGHPYLQKSWSILSARERVQPSTDVSSIDEAFLAPENRKDWLTDYGSAAEVLSGIFRALLRLENVRIILQDDTDFLHGWLSQGQAEFVRLSYEKYPDNNKINPSTFYESDKLYVPYCILTAMCDAKKRLKDIRFLSETQQNIVSSLLRPSLGQSLCTLRICVDAQDLEPRYTQSNPRAPPKLPFLAMLETLTQPEDLTLTLDLGCEIGEYGNYEIEHEDLAHGVLRALGGASNLRRFALEGEWGMPSNSLIAFVREHQSTLQSLVLYGIIVNGDWLPILQFLAVSSHLRYISILFPQETSPGAEIMDVHLASGCSDIARFNSFVENGLIHDEDQKARGAPNSTQGNAQGLSTVGGEATAE